MLLLCFERVNCDGRVRIVAHWSDLSCDELAAGDVYFERFARQPIKRKERASSSPRRT